MAELRLDVVLEPERTGASVAEVCRRHGISRETYYRYRRRYLAQGLGGLEDRTRAPLSSPGRIDPALEADIRRMRADHPRWGAAGSGPNSTAEGWIPPRCPPSTRPSGEADW